MIEVAGWIVILAICLVYWTALAALLVRMISHFWNDQRDKHDRLHWQIVELIKRLEKIEKEAK